MRLHNNTNRILPLGGSVRLMPKGQLVIEPDARQLLERPLVKAYLKDRSITLEKPVAPEKPEAEKPDNAGKAGQAPTDGSAADGASAGEADALASEQAAGKGGKSK